MKKGIFRALTAVVSLAVVSAGTLPLYAAPPLL